MNVQSKDATAIILAGGECSRMGMNKAFLDIKGVPLIQVVLAQFKPLCKDIIISTNDTRPYSFLNARIVEDRVVFNGPLSGMVQAMEAALYPACLVAACDLPEIPLGLARRMLELSLDYDCVVPRCGDFYEPLFAVYNKKIIHLMKESLSAGNRRIAKLYPQCNVYFIPIEKPLLNLNSFKDYKKYLEGLENK